MLLVEDVNHGQVASGDPSILPSTVVDHDVDSDVGSDEAHQRYSFTTGTWEATIVVSVGFRFDTKLNGF